MSRRDEDSIFPVDASGVMLGLLSGAVIGAAATLLLSSKAGEHLKENICDTCEGWAEKTKHFTDILSDKFSHNGKRSNETLNTIIGGIAGSILGAAAIILLNSDARKGLKKSIQHSIEKGSEMMHNISDSAHESYENAEDAIATWVEAVHDFLSRASRKRHDSFPEKALYWTLLGLKMFQKMKRD